MASGSLARRYAKALVALAAEAGVVDRVGKDLGRVAEVLDLSGGALRRALENPGLTITERRAIVDRVLARLSLHPYVQNFLRLVIDKGRFAFLGDMTRAYGEMADALAGRVRAVVTTAQPVSEALGRDILAALEQATNKHVLVTYKTDPTIIGGMVARVGDTVYDASVLGRLEELRLALAASAVAEA